MFGDVCPAQTNAAILLMMIATTSSRTCTKPIVVRSFFFTLQKVNLFFQTISNYILSV